MRDSYKEKLFSFIRTCIVFVLAVIMFYFFLPVGLVPEPVNNDENGEFVRIAPSYELYSDDKENDSLRRIGKNYNASYAFNIERFTETDSDEINSARVRFSFLKGSGELKNSVKVYSLSDGDLPDKAVIGGRPHFCAEFIAEINPYTTGADDNMCEIDLTEFVKSQLDLGKTEIKLQLFGENDKDLMIADSKFDDPMYRPCLKIATGQKYDTEAAAVKRAELREAVYVSSDKPDASGSELSVDNGLKLGYGNEIYLKFDLNENAILGSVHSAILSLNKYDVSPRRVKVYCINNNEWTGETISYNMRPRGDESTAFTGVIAPTGVDGRVNFDVTQAVCEARELGISSLTFRLVCDDTVIGFSGKDVVKFAPHLYLKASDNEDVVCAAEAALNALGTNRASFVTMNLLEEYSSENGKTAKIRWAEYDTDGDESAHKHLSDAGEVVRPKWFEGDDEILAVAEIRSGRYTTKRQFSLKVPAEASPDYSKYKFGNYIDIGKEESEEEQKFDSINTSGIHRRWADARMFTYRTIEYGGIMLLNFSCMPDTDNYITLKMWEGDKAVYSNFVLSVCGENNKSIILESAPESEIDDGGFVYTTYALPREFTEGKSYVSLCLEYSDAIKKENISLRGIYAAYMTQSAFFDPKNFVKQGEKPISEPFFGEDARAKFLENIGYLSIDSDIDETPEKKKNTLSIIEETGSVVFSDDDLNIAFSINEEEKKAFVYQKLEYYDRAADSCPVYSDNGLIAVDYGDYKLVWNKSDEAKQIPYEHLELSGGYKEVVGDTYCTFSEEWQMTDDSVIPDGTEVIDGRNITVNPKMVILLSHIADPMHDSDWRVNRVNGRNISGLTMGSYEKIDNITFKSVGGLTEDVDEVTVMVAVYMDEKIISIGRKKIPVISSVDIYTVDMSEFNIFMQKGCTMRVFVYDDTENLVDIEPKFEL